MKIKFTFAKVLTSLFFLGFAGMALYLLVGSFIPSTWFYAPIHSKNLSDVFFGVWGFRAVFFLGMAASVYFIAERLEPRKKELERWIKELDGRILGYEKQKAEAIKFKEKYQDELNNLK